MHNNSQISVIVVDDETAIRKSLTGFLEDYGFHVVSYASAEEALQVSDTQSCDVAIVDMRLPGMDGDALIMKLYERAPHMRFIIYTGSVNYQHSSELEKIGVQRSHILKKPLNDLSILVTHIQDLVQEKKETHGE